LTLNVIRPAQASTCVRKRDDLLPVAVFLHGGGWASDFSANGVYNLSFIVEESVNTGKPILAVSVEYRLSFWGFLASEDIIDADVANLGLKDQHLSLRWIQENIASFGGDPTKVTIFGESAGGGNVGYMATAYGGRDEGLFRGMIAQSGADGSHMKNLTAPQQKYDTIVAAVGCGDRSDRLACLREVPFDKLNATITLTSGGFTPIVDGTFIPDYPSKLLSEGRFVKAPLIVGTNTDEGTLFGQAGIDSDEQFEGLVRSKGVDEETVGVISALYPNIDALGLPSDYRVVPGAVGSQFKRTMAFQTDQMFLTWTRLRSSAWAQHGVPTFAYLFQTNFRVRGSKHDPAV
jgi:carboxylesterase type B